MQEPALPDATGVALGGTAALVAPPDVFTPTRPIRGGQELVGRQQEIARILEALTEEQAHVVLYAERGRGKTSLVNSVVQALRARGHIVARHTCEAGSNYDSLTRGLARDLPRGLLAVPMNRDAADRDAEPRSAGCDAAFPAGPLRPQDVVGLPGRLKTTGLICVVDEFDRIEDAATRTAMADTIKQLADRAVPLSFMLVGVADSLDHLLGEHPSIQRALVAVHLPLLSREYVSELISGGLRHAGITVERQSLEILATLSLGMPYVAQLLGLRMVQVVRARDGKAVRDVDLRSALRRIVDEANPRVMAMLASLTDDGRDHAMAVALQRVALARQDRYGRIQGELRPDGMHLGEQIVAVACWERLLHARVVRAWSDPTAAGNSRWFGFGERSLIHHVLLKAVLDNVLLNTQPASGSDYLAADLNAR